MLVSKIITSIIAIYHVFATKICMSVQVYLTSCTCFDQFVCVESLVTAMMDMYPATFRRKNRRELFILVVALLSFLMGLIMLTEVCFK